MLGWARRQALGQEGRAAAQDEAVAGRQGEEQLCDLQLEVGERDVGGHYGATCIAINGAQAARRSRGSSSSSHRSTSRTPST